MTHGDEDDEDDNDEDDEDGYEYEYEYDVCCLVRALTVCLHYSAYYKLLDAPGPPLKGKDSPGRSCRKKKNVDSPTAL